MDRKKLAICLMSIQLLTCLFIPRHLEAWCGRPYCYECNQEDDGVCHLFYGAEALYWTINQSDLDYAVDLDPANEDTILGQGKTHFLDYDWDFGVRVWFGWNWSHGWDLKLAYTHYANETKRKTDFSGDALVLKPALLHPETVEGIADLASGKIHLEYQTADAIFGKVICFCNNQFVLHPFFGARGLRLEQLLKALYKGGDFVDELENSTPGQVKWNSGTIAGGIRAGMDLNLRGEWGLGLYGSFAGSILASRIDNKHKQRTLDSTGDVLSTEIDLKEKQWLSLPGFDVACGLSWDFCCNGCIYYKFKLGYEFNKWFDIQQIRRYHAGNEGVSSNNTSCNLGLHGGIFSAEIYF